MAATSCSCRGTPARSPRKIQLASLDGGPSTTLFESESAAIVAGNYFVYVRDLPSRLLAQAFDPARSQLEGRPVAVVDDDNVAFLVADRRPAVSASATTLVYTDGQVPRQNQLTWFNRTGQPLGTVGDPDVYYDPTLSLDGTIARGREARSGSTATDLWTVDLARGAFSRLTSTPGFESVPTWSPDGRRIAFASDQGTGAEASA